MTVSDSLVQGGAQSAAAVHGVARRALAELVQLLLIGEETAAIAFTVLARRCRRRGDAHLLGTTLMGIATDEREHERLLRAFRQTLPAAELTAPQRSASKKFFSSLMSDDVGEHLTRIAALDSAVCLLLAALRKAQPGFFDPCLRRILSDEARHVAMANACARRLSSERSRHELAAATRAGLVELLMPSAHCLESLSMNPERLLERLSRPPHFLYT